MRAKARLISTDATTVRPKFLKNWPETPGIRPTGRNTATIDMVVASVLMAMGMMMVSPAIVSLPFKLMLFVLVDGWRLVSSGLVQGFAEAAGVGG